MTTTRQRPTPPGDPPQPGPPPGDPPQPPVPSPGQLTIDGDDLTEMTLNLDSFNSESLRRIGCALATGELEMPMGDPLQQLQEIILTRKPRRWR